MHIKHYDTVKGLQLNKNNTVIKVTLENRDNCEVIRHRLIILTDIVALFKDRNDKFKWYSMPKLFINICYVEFEGKYMKLAMLNIPKIKVQDKINIKDEHVIIDSTHKQKGILTLELQHINRLNKFVQLCSYDTYNELSNNTNMLGDNISDEELNKLLYCKLSDVYAHIE